MSEAKKRVIKAINDVFQHMPAERRGYLLGYMEAMADRQDDEKKAREEKEEQPA